MNDNPPNLIPIKERMQAAHNSYIDNLHKAALEENKLKTEALTSKARELLKPESPLTSEERAQLAAAVNETTRHFVELKQLVTELDTKYPIHSQPELAVPTIDLSEKKSVDAFIPALQAQLKEIPTDKLMVLIKNGVQMVDFLPENFDFKLPASISTINARSFDGVSEITDALSANHSLVANAVNELFQRMLAEIAFSPSSTENPLSPQVQGQMIDELAQTAREIYPHLAVHFDVTFKNALMNAYNVASLAPSLFQADLSIAKSLLGISNDNQDKRLTVLNLVDSGRKDKILAAIKTVLNDPKFAYMLDKMIAGTTVDYHLGRYGGQLNEPWTENLSTITQHFDAIEAARQISTESQQS